MPIKSPLPALKEFFAPPVPFSQMHKRGAWKLEPSPASFTPLDAPYSSNSDMDVTPPAKRTWGAVSFLTLWISDACNVTTMQQASSLIATGLTWKEVMPIIAASNIIIGVLIAFNGAIGAKYKLPFSVLARASFGSKFAYFAICSRLALGLIYCGIQCTIGGTCVGIMLRAMSPAFGRLPNSLPSDAGITTQGLISYFVYFCIQQPLLLISPDKLKFLFAVKSVVVLVSAFSLLGWAMATGGTGPIVNQTSALTGSTYSWAIMFALNSAVSGKTTLAINMPDFTRYSKPGSNAHWLQLLFVPLTYTIFSLVGVFIASSSNVIYGRVFWDPLLIIQQWESRPAAFFLACGFLIATLGSNISANVVACSNDMVVCFPKYLNIRRAAFITGVLGSWATIPWKIQSSGATLLTFLSAYAIVLAPIIAVLIMDFWVIKHRNYSVPALYRPKDIYRYTGGINWRAAVAVFCTLPFNLPGLINRLSSSVQVGIFSFWYQTSWYNALVFTSIVYYTLNKFFPHYPTLLEDSIYDDEGGNGEKRGAQIESVPYGGSVEAQDDFDEKK